MPHGVPFPDDSAVFIISMITVLCFVEQLKVLVVRAVDVYNVS